MAEITAAVDEQGANDLLDAAIATNLKVLAYDD